MKFLKVKFLILGGLASFLIFLTYFSLPNFFKVSYVSQSKAEEGDKQNPRELSGKEEEITEIPRIVTHIKTPEPLKGIYMTSWVAGTPSFRSKLISLAENTEINAILIDIKDYTGKISFKVSNPDLEKFGASEKRIADIEELIDLLHSKNIYVIGRVSVFQDPHLVKKRPDLAVKKESDKNLVWKDRKGISWLDAGEEEVWQYATLIGKVAFDLGFDEINYDYIRFPSDGNMKDIYFPKSEGLIKSEVIKSFFQYLDKNLRTQAPGIVLSADLFGMTVTNTDDLGIGQVLENALPYFDYIAPMVYPSHFPNGWNGLKNPSANPYEVIKYSMDKAVERTKIANQNPLKIRPWLQDFDLGATYTKEMVQAQIKAVYDSGLTSWILWDPKNIYTAGALKNELSEEAIGHTAISN